MSGSVFFPKPRRRSYRQRGQAGSVNYNMTLDPAVKVLLEREAAASEVSLSYLMQEGAQRLAVLSREERELGILPLPLRIEENELEAIRAAARRAGQDLETWAIRALLDAASGLPSRVAA